jgi:CubicO group peptidase (beta-lactamase class C family)
MTPDTIFPIHSMTKTITSFAVMMLIDQGKLRLDDQLAKYIPSFAGVRVGVETKDENGTPMLTIMSPRRPINIEDLLLHTSGITYEFKSHGLVKKAYAGITIGDFDNAEFVERLAKLPLAEQPGTLWDYGHSTDVLGRVVEVVSGQSLYEFEKEQLLDPLVMSSTKFFLTDPAERSRLAKPLPAERSIARGPLDVTRWESSGSGMVSTITDFSRFARMLLHGGALDGHRFLKPETFKAMTTDHIEPGSGVARNYFYFPGDGFGFGYGFGIRTDPGNAVPPPPGSIGEIKWDGASGTYFVVDPANDMFFILLEDAPVQRGNIQRILKQIIYDSFQD